MLVGFLFSDILQDNWFGGNEKPIGECGCEDGMEWDDDDLECERRWNSGIKQGFKWFGMGVAGFIIFIIIATCCCCGICCFIAKKFLGKA